jgi:hypothetical protein
MKKKVKKFAEGGYGRFTEDSPKSVEDSKSGLFSGAAAPDESDTYAPKTRTFSTTSPAKPKPRVSAPKTKVGTGASGFPVDEKAMAERGYEANRSKSSDVMSNDEYIKRHRFGTSDGSLTPEQSIKKAQGMKKGGKVSSASSRADGCAQKGKTRGKMC